MNGDGIWLRFVSGPDIEALAITRTEIVDAVSGVVAAHGRGQTVFEPRVHLVPDNGGAGHFNVLRGHVSALGGDRPGRESADERILLWHRGLSILDVSVAHLILERAVAAGAGTMLRYH